MKNHNHRHCQKSATDHTRPSVLQGTLGFVSTLSVLAGVFSCLVLMGCVNTPEHRSFRVQLISDIRLPMGIPNADHKETLMILGYDVLEIDPDGVARVELTIESIKASMISLTKRFSYDSEAEEQTESSKSDLARQDQFKQSFHGLKGKKYGARVEDTGRVLELIDLDPRIDRVVSGKAKGMFGGDQVAMLLTKSNLKEYAAAGWYRNLEKDNQNSTRPWTHDSVILVPSAKPVQVRKRYQLERIEKIEDRQIATVSYQVSLIEESASDANQAAPNAKKFRGSDLIVTAVLGEGELSVLSKTGTLLKLEEQLRIEVRTGYALPKQRSPKKRKTLKIFYVIKRTIELVEEQ